MNEWISINDKLPTNSKPVLITDGNEVIMGRFCLTCQVFEANFEEFTLSDCSHWMPLPESPK